MPAPRYAIVIRRHLPIFHGIHVGMLSRPAETPNHRLNGAPQYPATSWLFFTRLHSPQVAKADQPPRCKLERLHLFTRLHTGCLAWAVGADIAGCTSRPQRVRLPALSAAMWMRSLSDIISAQRYQFTTSSASCGLMKSNRNVASQ